MTDYKIAAIPTEYRGRKYRSRLEARWAAFFGLLGWKHEYEPFDLGKWSPDFLLPDFDVLVEVKPLRTFCQNTWSKITSAGGYRFVLLTQAAPTKSHENLVSLGWVGRSSGLCQAMVAWCPEESEPNLTSDIIAIERAGIFRVSSREYVAVAYDGDLHKCGPEPLGYADYAMSLWAKATNEVQWIPGEKR